MLLVGAAKTSPGPPRRGRPQQAPRLRPAERQVRPGHRAPLPRRADLVLDQLPLLAVNLRLRLPTSASRSGTLFCPLERRAQGRSPNAATSPRLHGLSSTTTGSLETRRRPWPSPPDNQTRRAPHAGRPYLHHDTGLQLAEVSDARLTSAGSTASMSSLRRVGHSTLNFGAGSRRSRSPTASTDRHPSAPPRSTSQRPCLERHVKVAGGEQQVHHDWLARRPVRRAQSSTGFRSQIFPAESSASGFGKSGSVFTIACTRCRLTPSILAISATPTRSSTSGRYGKL